MAESAEKRGPGRPKGLPKTGGRQPGSGNRVPAELRQFINQRGRPLELLSAIADGRKVSAADPEDPGRKIRVYPSLKERTVAATTLLNKLLPDLRATELTGKDGEALIPDDQPVSDFELARKAAFLLAKVNHQLVEREEAERAAQRQPSPATPVRVPEPTSVPVAASAPPEPQPEPPRQPGETHQVGELSITFAEQLPGDRERWAIRDGSGRLVGAAFGREAAEIKARVINGDTDD